jgi:hypothetical protein
MQSPLRGGEENMRSVQGYFWKSFFYNCLLDVTGLVWVMDGVLGVNIKWINKYLAHFPPSELFWKFCKLPSVWIILKILHTSLRLNYFENFAHFPPSELFWKFCTLPPVWIILKILHNSLRLNYFENCSRFFGE